MKKVILILFSIILIPFFLISNSVAGEIAGKKARKLYVHNSRSPFINVYRLPHEEECKPLRIISDKDNLNKPTGIAVDTKNNEIFVVNSGNNSILVYDKRADKKAVPLRIIKGDSAGKIGSNYESRTIGIIVDLSNDKLYVISSFYNGGLKAYMRAIAVFNRNADGDEAPIEIVTMWGHPIDLEFDPTRNEFYVTDESQSQVNVFNNIYPWQRSRSKVRETSKEPPFYAHDVTRSIGDNQGYNMGLAIDFENKEVIVANEDPDIMVDIRNLSEGYSVNVIARSQGLKVPAKRTIRRTGIQKARGVTLDRDNKEILVVNNDGKFFSIEVFPQFADGLVEYPRIIAGIESGLSDPWDIAVDTVNNEIFVSNMGNNTVTVYSRTANCNVSEPDRLFFDDFELASIDVNEKNGELYAVDANIHSVVVYNSLTKGTNRIGIMNRIRWIIGNLTGMNKPESIVYDPVNNELYVGNSGNASITVYDGSANGNVAPKRMISGDLTGLAGPVKLALDSVGGEIYVISRTEYDDEKGTKGEDKNKEEGSILVFDRNASGNTPPLRTISGYWTGLQSLKGIVVDNVNDELYIFENSSYMVFDKNAQV